MRRIGIFGGSFNPIHNGHIALARYLRQTAGLDEVWLMVSPLNPLKRQADLLDDEQRLKLAQTALQGVEGIMASDYEMHLPRPSYTWNTLQALSHDYPDSEFVLLIGGDNWERFGRWYHWKDILRNHRVVVYPRSPYPGTVELPLIDVSSTEIRRRVRVGQSIDGLVPEQVAAYIKKRGLYTSPILPQGEENLYGQR